MSEIGVVAGATVGKTSGVGTTSVSGAAGVAGGVVASGVGVTACATAVAMLPQQLVPVFPLAG